MTTSIPSSADPALPDELTAALIAAVNDGDASRLVALAAPDFRCAGLPFVGPPALAAPYQEMRAALPELRITIEQVFVAGNEIAVRYGGRAGHGGFYLGQPPGGNAVTVQGLDVFEVEGDRIRGLRAYGDRLALLQQMTDPQPGAWAVRAVEVEVVSRFEPPAFLEGVMVGAGGEIYVTKLHEGTVYRIQPDGTREVFFHVDTGPGPWSGAWCMVAADDGAGFFLNVNSAAAQLHGVWHVLPDGSGRPFATLPLNTIPNGIARTAAGDLLVADSLGAVWRVAPDGRASEWLRHESLAGRAHIGRFPGANGIQVWNGAAYVTNSDRGIIVRIPIGPRGEAGIPEIAARGIGGDDFAIDADGSLYVTTHPFNTVVKLGSDGSFTVIAGAAQGVVGPTAAALAVDSSGRRMLYVITDGGFFTLPEDPPIAVPAQSPALLRLKLD